MSVRVNLLPQSTRDGRRAARQRRMVAGAGLALIASLGAVHVWSVGQVRDAEERLLAAESATALVRNDVNAMSEFRELELRRQNAAAALHDALGHEVSLSWILYDLATVMPRDAQLETISINLPRPVAESPHVGSFTLTGKSVEAHAPGVEAILHELSRLASFQNLYFNSSSLDDGEGDVASFSIDGELAPLARTNRYAEGLPEAMR
ncbi:PilN domain-containing protein [Egicoccus sp. AB-alg6-2]|uniref:PilN domain-containing protein n=1 Tax=Egicoccus sp. AB-alg6-2 TaxID=3242692 RepID=UPI00359D45B2